MSQISVELKTMILVVDQHSFQPSLLPKERRKQRSSLLRFPPSVYYGDPLLYFRPAAANRYCFNNRQFTVHQIDLRSDDELLEVVVLGLLDVVLGLDFSGGEDLPLLSSARLLDLPLELLLGLALGVLLREDGESPEAVVGLVLDQVLLVVVGQAEASGPVASEGSPEAEEHQVFDLPLILVGDEFLEVLLRDVGLALVVDVQQQLLSRQQLVYAQSASLDGDGHKYNNIYQKIQFINQTVTSNDIPYHFSFFALFRFVKYVFGFTGRSLPNIDFHSKSNIILTYSMQLTRKIASVVSRFSSSNDLNALTLMNHSEKESYLQLIEQNALLSHRLYPALPHQDPTSPEYIPSQLDQYHDKTNAQTYNAVINNFKNDLKVQRQIWESITKLDRPYKQGIPGIDTNIDPNGAATEKLPDLGFPRRDIDNEHVWTFANEDRFVANTIWNELVPFKHVVQWQKQRLNRPVTRDYNHAKGYKYDIPVKAQEKYEYVSDRLGHPEFFGTPMDRLLKLQKDIYHPTFCDQPFVKMPSQYPSQTLNFEQGEVLYENTRVLEWIRAFQLGNVALLAYFGVVVPLNMAFKTNLVVDKADQLWIGQQHLWNPYSVDVARLFTPISTLGVYYILYASMKAITTFAGQYAVKVSYSKDRELLFVKRVNNYGIIEEDVYETAHLQILPPRQRSGVQDLSSQDDDGLWRIQCLNSQRNILLYNQNDYWNRKLKAEFLESKLNFWDKSYYGYNRKQEGEREEKWRTQVNNSINQEALPAK